MKKALFTLAAAVLCLCAQAQNTSTDSLSQQVDSLQKVISQLSNKVGATEEADLDQQIWKDRAKFFSIGIGKQTLTDMDVDGVKWDSELAISMLWGRTYYFPKKAWFGMLKLGIDFAWMDMSYAKYKDFSETEMQPTGGTYDWGSGYPGYYEEDDDDLAAKPRCNPPAVRMTGAAAIRVTTKRTMTTSTSAYGKPNMPCAWVRP